MRKKLLAMLLLIVCVMAQAVTVSAADLSSLPKPGEGVDLISSKNLYRNSDGSFQFDGAENDQYYLTYAGDSRVKAVTYSPSTGLYWYSRVDMVTIDSGMGDDPQQAEQFVVKSTRSYEEAIQNAYVMGNGDTFAIVLDLNGVTVFTDASGAELYGCSLEDLLEHVQDGNAGQKNYNGESANLKVEVLEKLSRNNSIYGAKFRLTYDLPGYDWNGVLKPENGSYITVSTLSGKIDCPQISSSGTVDFTIDDLRNRDYEIELRTDAGNRYKTIYRVDFADVMSDEAYAGSWDAPVVEILGIPEDDDVVPSPLVLTLKANMPVIFTWNGYRVSDDYLRETTVTVGSNDTYNWTAVSEVGKSTQGKVTIKGVSFVGGKETLSDAERLVQTGEEVQQSQSTVWLVLSFVSLGVVFAGGYMIYRKRGEKA